MADTVAERQFVWDQGKTPEDLAAKRVALAARAEAVPAIAPVAIPVKLKVGQIILGVFVGNLISAIVLSIAYLVLSHR